MERAADVADGPAEEIEREETRSVLLAGLERLPARQKETLRLKFQAGLGYAEIAGVMETSIGNVGYLIHVGLKNLRERLAPRAHDLGALQG